MNKCGAETHLPPALKTNREDNIMQTKFDVGQTVYIPFKIIKISATKNIEYKVRSLHSLSSPFYTDIIEQDLLKWKEEIDNEIIYCKNCKYRGKVGGASVCNYVYNYVYYGWKDDDFCSKARKVEVDE